jgi:uncharacterized protein (DUF2132 family)
MNNQQPNNALHGVSLKKILEDLVEYYGWEYLSHRIEIRCFMFDPSITSSLKFLRKTPWAREKVEKMWIDSDILK